MKATVYGLLAGVIALVVLAMPMKALAHEHHGWHHDNGNHFGWYKHQGGYGYGAGYGGYPGGWHHHDHDWYEHHGYGGNAYGYGGYPGNYGSGGYPGNYGSGGYPGGYGYGAYPGGMTCDDDGDDCQPAPPVSVPFSPGYSVPGSYYTPGYYGQSGYGSGYAPNAGKLMQLQQKMSQRLYANQALYQAAMARGNYGLANKAAARMQNQSATISAASAMLNGAAAPGYPAYNQPAYGANPYYGQAGGSPLGSILQMIGY